MNWTDENYISELDARMHSTLMASQEELLQSRLDEARGLAFRYHEEAKRSRRALMQLAWGAGIIALVAVVGWWKWWMK